MKPVQFLLQVQRHIYGERLYNPDFTKYSHPRGDYNDYDSPDEIIEAMIENGWSKEDAEKERKHIHEYQGEGYWDTEQVFLTEEGVKRHLEQNSQNLYQPRDYVVHAFRNPEMKELYDAIRAVVSLEEWKMKTLSELQDEIDHPEKYIRGEWPVSDFKEESKRIMQEAVQKLTEDTRKS